MEFSKVSEMTIKGKSVRSIAKGGKECWGKHHLPIAYQEVAYIESTGTQFIDTKICFPDVDTFRVTASLNDVSSSQYIIGTRDDAGTAIGFAVCFAGHGGLTYYPRLWRSVDIASAVRIGEQFTVETKIAKKGGYFKTNGLTKDEYNVNQLVAQRSIFLFALNSGTSEYTMKGRIYSVQAYLGGTLTHSYIPCYRKSDRKAGLFDIVTRHFYTNGGTGSFNRGPDV